MCNSDNQLQMDKEINLHGKKKVSSKRVTGLQFLLSDNDSDKVMVTSADSQIRIICGEDVICKLKGQDLFITALHLFYLRLKIINFCCACSF